MPTPPHPSIADFGAPMCAPDDVLGAPPRDLIAEADNLALGAILGDRGPERPRLAYLDPPYATGSTFRTRLLLGDAAPPRPLDVHRQADAVAYDDRWVGGRAAYLAAMRARLELVHEALAPEGSLVLHGDVSMGPHLKVLADDVFGAASFRGAIAWHYYNKLPDRRKRAPPSAFDLLWWYVKDPRAAFVYHPLEEPRARPVRQLVRKKVDGRVVNARGDDGRLLYRERHTRLVDNVWRIRGLQPAALDEYVHFETQKPLDLIERLLRMLTEPGDLVLDPFLGSGTTAVAAARLGRRFVGLDARPLAVHLARKRLFADAARRGVDPPPLRVVHGAPAEPPHVEARWVPAQGAVALVAFRSPALERVVGHDALERWSDAVDYWAVDWGPGEGHAFVEGWRAFRTRRARALPLVAPAPPGVDPRRVRVRACDALGHASAPAGLGPG